MFLLIGEQCIGYNYGKITFFCHNMCHDKEKERANDPYIPKNAKNTGFAQKIHVSRETSVVKHPNLC